jgi:hypothetical protein
MKAEFTIDNGYHLVCETGFFYLFNWYYDNRIALINFRNKRDEYRENLNCAGVWKLKQLK